MTEPSREQLLAANEDAATYFRRRLLGPDGAGPRGYLVERGFDALLDDTRWTVGYAPGPWTPLHDELSRLGYSDQTLLTAGLASRTRRNTVIDRFRNRITFGVRDRAGEMLGFVARSAPAAAQSIPRYLNTATTPLYNKSTTVFGLGEAQDSEHPTIVLTEGPLDAIAIDLANGNAPPRLTPLAACGTSIARAHRALIKALEPDRVILAFDNDPPGRRALATGYRLLHDVADVRAVSTPSAADPAEMLRSSGLKAVSKSVREAPPAADVIVDHHIASWPAKKAGAEADLCLLREVIAEVAQLPSIDVARQVGRLAQRLPFDLETVTRELTNSASRATCANQRPDDPTVGRCPGQASVYRTAAGWREGRGR